MYYEWWISNVKLKWQSIFYQCQFPTQPNMIDKFQCKCMNEAAQIQCKWNMVKLSWRVLGNIFSTLFFYFSYIGLSRVYQTHTQAKEMQLFCKSWNENQTVFPMYMILKRKVDSVTFSNVFMSWFSLNSFSDDVSLHVWGFLD